MNRTIVNNVEWISVEDRLPQYDKEVVYIDKSNDIHLGRLESGMGKEIYWTHYDFLEDEDVTHWMPLPHPPKEF